MPFFFIISGFLQKERAPLEELKRSAKALLLPYVIYNVYLLIYSCFTGEFNANYPVMMLTGRQWYLSMACRPMWFLLSLFIIRMFYSFTGLRKGIILGILCMGGTALGKHYGLLDAKTDWYQYQTAIICFPFFILGNAIRQFGLHKCLDKVNGWIAVVILPATFAAGLFLCSKNGFVNIFRCTPGDNTILFYAAGSLLAFSLFVTIYKTLDIKNSYIQLVSEGTLLIFAVHQSILWPMHKILSGHGMIFSLAVAATTVVILSGGAWLARKYCPVLIGK